MSTKIFGYARVSTIEQNVERQEDALHSAGVDSAAVFVDRISGTTASRPQLDTLMSQLRNEDILVILSLDRLGRNTRQLLAWIDELRERGVSLRILQLGVDTATPAGRLVLTVIAALAQMERETLVQRTREGLAAARARGRVGGRPSALSPAQRSEVVRLHAEGRPSGEMAALFECSSRTVRRVVAEATK